MVSRERAQEFNSNLVAAGLVVYPNIALRQSNLSIIKSPLDTSQKNEIKKNHQVSSFRIDYGALSQYMISHQKISNIEKKKASKAGNGISSKLSLNSALLTFEERKKKKLALLTPEPRKEDRKSPGQFLFVRPLTRDTNIFTKEFQEQKKPYFNIKLREESKVKNFLKLTENEEKEDAKENESRKNQGDILKYGFLKPYVPFVIKSTPSPKPIVNIPNKEIEKKKIQDKFEDKNDQQQFFYKIFEGNNSELVRRVMKNRIWWAEVNGDSIPDFIWQPVSNGYKFHKVNLDEGKIAKQCFNHLEFHKEISNKANLLKNLKEYSKIRNLDVFSLCPVSFFIDMGNTDFDKQIKEFAHVYFSIQKKCCPENLLRKILSDPFEKLMEVVSAKGDERREKSMSAKQIRTKEPLSSEQHNKATTKIKIPDSFLDGGNIWLLKPTDLNRGRGIKIFKTLENLEELLSNFFKYGYSEPPKNKIIESKKDLVKSKISESPEKPSTMIELQRPSTTKEGQRNTDYRQAKFLRSKTKKGVRCFVIQKYIEKPLLIEGRKFDFRVWALITWETKLFFFKEGYIRTSSEQFNLEEEKIGNRMVHLTNNAVQKYSVSYGNFEPGNQISFASFEKYLSEKNPKISFKRDVVARMKELITFSIESVKIKINKNSRLNCFEIFGYDFIIDSDYKTWLIEVNTNPCIEESSPILEILLPRMLDDAFKLTLDLVFPPRFSQQMKNKSYSQNDEKDRKAYSVQGYPDGENLWEYLGEFK